MSYGDFYFYPYRKKTLILSFTKKEAKLNVFRPLFYIFSRIKILTPQPYQQFFQYPYW